MIQYQQNAHKLQLLHDISCVRPTPIFPLLRYKSCEIFLKDETVHPIPNLKFRIIPQLLIYALKHNLIHSYSHILESSSGSSAHVLAFLCKKIHLPFIAVTSQNTSYEHLDALRKADATIIYHAPLEDKKIALEYAQKHKYIYYTNQFDTLFECTKNDASSLLLEIQKQEQTLPDWLVCGCGTGATSGLIGYHARQFNLPTKVCIADPVNSVFYNIVQSGQTDYRIQAISKVNGIGRPALEQSFQQEYISAATRMNDDMIGASLSILSAITKKTFGPSTAANFYASLVLADNLAQSTTHKQRIVIIAGDLGNMHISTWYNQQWIHQNCPKIQQYKEHIQYVLNHSTTKLSLPHHGFYYHNTPQHHA